MSQLNALMQKINGAPSVREAISLAQERWEKNYFLVTGKKDGSLRFQNEFLNYLEIMNEKPDLQKVQDKMQHFAAIMKASHTGLSFRSEGHLYPMVIGGKIQVRVGAHGKREMLRNMPGMKFVHEGQLVMKGDDFVYSKIEGRITKHETTGKSEHALTIDNIVAAYVRMEFADGRIIDTVVWNDELRKAMDASQNKGPNSVWVKWCGEMCKKVAYHRAKKLHHRYKEGVELIMGGEHNNDEEETQDVSYESQTVTTTDGDKVDESTGEVVEEAQVVDKKEEPGALI